MTDEQRQRRALRVFKLTQIKHTLTDARTVAQVLSSFRPHPALAEMYDDTVSSLDRRLLDAVWAIDDFMNHKYLLPDDRTIDDEKWLADRSDIRADIEAGLAAEAAGIEPKSWDQVVADVHLLQENTALRAALRVQWEYNHFEHCSREWPHPEGESCMWPYPDLLKSPLQDDDKS